MLTLIKRIGTAASIAGAFTVAFKLFPLGYVLFMIGSISWAYIGFVSKERELLVLNGVFFVANIIGLINSI